MKRLEEGADDCDTNRTIHLNGNSYPLLFDITQDPGPTIRLYGRVRYPDNYPKTKIRSEMAMTEGFAYVAIYVKFKGDPSGLNLTGSDIYLSRFYTASMFKHLLLPEELEAIRGLGRQLLCTVLNYIYSQGYILDPAACMLRLEAAGGTRKNMSAFENTSQENLDAFFSKYPRTMRDVLAKMQLEYYGKLDKLTAMRQTMCEGVQNLELVAHYEKTYGFEAYDIRSSTSVLMETLLVVALKHCEDVSNYQTREPSFKKIEYCCIQCQWREPRLKTVDGNMNMFCSRNCAKIHHILSFSTRAP